MVGNVGGSVNCVREVLSESGVNEGWLFFCQSEAGSLYSVISSTKWIYQKLKIRDVREKKWSMIREKLVQKGQDDGAIR
jgi:hypothetical protein